MFSRQPLALIILFLTAGLGQALGAEYLHPERKFRFQYDEAKWEIVPSTDPKAQPGAEVDRTMASMTLVNVQRKQADEKYRARFSVVVDGSKKLTGTADEKFSAYQKHAVDFMKGQRFHILSTTSLRLPQIPEPTFEIVANQRDFGLKFRQLVFMKGQEAFLLTAAARTTKFSDYDKEIQAMLDSFRFDK